MKLSEKATGRLTPSADLLHEDVACPLCGPQTTSTLFTQPPFRIVRCAGCGLVYTLPRLASTDLHAMYQVDYWTSRDAKHFGYTNYLQNRDNYLRTYRLRSQVVTRHQPLAGRVLDVGCAAGFFLKVMHDKGWETTGVEISAKMVDYARHELALPDIRCGTLEQQSLDEAAYDVIALWDVIEHLEDPRSVLAHARKYLKDDGILVIETQNVESWFAKMMGPRWQHFKFEEHLWHFSPQTIANLLAREQYELIELSPRLGGKYVSLDFIVERAARLHPLLSILLSPLRLLGQRSLYVNPMDEIIVVARKQKPAVNAAI